MREFSVRLIGERSEGKPPYGASPAEIIEYTGSDTVFFDDNMSCIAVKRSLIEHDGYPANIYVKRRRKEQRP